MPSLADSDVVSSLPCFSGACPPPRVESAASMRGELGLGEGRSNHNFIVTTSDGRRFFVRLGDDLPAFGVSRAHEHAAAQAAAAAGVGPVVIFASLHHCALVFELIEGGKALTEEEIRSATSSEGGKALTEEEIRSATSSDQDDTSALSLKISLKKVFKSSRKYRSHTRPFAQDPTTPCASRRF